ncbi:MAG: metallopeptidase family protein [Chloroflexota bacterium]|nr:MAG: metallopeptidase family protein [Chloroflexota bacterium]
MIAQEEFERIVDETVAQLPEQFRARIENLAIVVEEFPDAWTLQSVGLKNRYGLLGFYHGVPLTLRTQNYGSVAPDLISIYRQPIMSYYRTDEAIRAGIRHTVLHELAHYFGISDERLHELGAY